MSTPAAPTPAPHAAAAAAVTAQTASAQAQPQGKSAAKPQQQRHQQQRNNQQKQPKQPKPKAAATPSDGAAAGVSGSLPSLLSHPSFSSFELCDIGANLLDDMFSGQYHGRRKHPADLPQVLERAAQRAVKRIIVTAGSAAEGREALQLVHALEAQAASEGRSFPELYSTVGVHPTRSNLWNGDEAHQQGYFDQLLEAILQGLGGKAGGGAPHTAGAAAAAAAVGAAAGARASDRRIVVAVGECGLDYDRLHFSDKASQLRHFAKHFDLVERVADRTAGWPGGPVQLPLFLHDRNTGGDFHSIVRANRHRFKHGVVHSFTGSIDEVQALLALDLHIGINGCSLKTEDNLAVLNHIPLNRLLIETDAPWCEIRTTHASFPMVRSAVPAVKTPEQWRSDLAVKGRCEPGSLLAVLEVIAAHIGVEPLELAQQVWKNTNEVFFVWKTGTDRVADAESTKPPTSK